MTATKQLDKTFFAIFGQINQSVIANSEQAAQHVLDASEEFLSEKANKAVKDFHALYFSTVNIDLETQAMNKEVDDLFDQVQSALASGDESLANLAENDKKRQARLGLAAVQKELETMIRLEHGIKEKLLPVLSSVQFEDMLRHRLTNIEKGWKIITNALGDEQIDDLDAVKSQILELISSNAERGLYYRLVLKQTAPKLDDEDEIWFDLTS